MSDKNLETAAQVNAIEEAEKRPNRQISVTVPAEMYDGFLDHTWTARKKIGQLFTAALEDYAAANGVAIDGTAPHAE